QQLDRLISDYEQEFDEKKKASLSKTIQEKIYFMSSTIPTYQQTHIKFFASKHLRFPDLTFPTLSHQVPELGWIDQQPVSSD
ncbi:MAG: hypothetical protein OXC40_04250, partial [Proteobacteria bacterium]|nr:hypothetical protein [Pseudomonadota bacterium]